MHKKWSFLLRISSVNVTKSAVTFAEEKNFIFCAVFHANLIRKICIFALETFLIQFLILVTF